MSDRRVRRLKDKAARLIDKEKLKQALVVYNELLQLESHDPNLMLRAGDLNHRLGYNRDAIDVYSRAAQHYARDGMLLRGIAVCKVILGIDPTHTTTLEQLAELNTRQYGAPQVPAPQPREATPDPAADDFSIEVDLSSVTPAAPTLKTEPKQVETATEQQSARKLPRIPLFSELDRQSFVELLGRIPIHRFAAGEQVVREGDQGRSFFVIVTGAVRVVKAGGIHLAELGPGAFFGEMALVTDRPRQASVETIAPSEILELPKQDLDQLVRRFPHVSQTLRHFTEQRLLANLMLTSPLFAPFSPAEREALIRYFEVRSYTEGAQIIEQGRSGDGLYLIVSGTADVIRTTANGSQHNLAVLQEGDLFGEIALLNRSETTATVRARHDVRMLCLPESVFNEIIMTHPQILMLVSELSEERRKDFERLERELASESDGGSAPL